MKKFYLLAAMLISFSTIAFAQLPIAYYDFENSAHSTFQATVDMEVNSGSTSVTNNNGTMVAAGGTGAAGEYGNWFASGKAMQVYLGATSTSTDPKTGATHYQQFKVSSAGFSGLAVVFDVNPNNDNSEDYGICYSTNGSSWTWVASVATPGSGNTFPTSTDSWNTALINLPAGANNQSNLYIRLYEYKSGSNNSSAYIRIDNLQVTATSTVAAAGTKTMLDDRAVAAGYLSTSSSSSTFSRNKFTVDGAGTTVNMNSCYFAGIAFGAAGNLTVSNNAVLNLAGSTYDNYVAGAGWFVSASTINILSGATINLNNNLNCDGNIVLTSGTLNVNNKTLQIGGTVSRTSGLINATLGTVEFTGSSTQSIAGSFFTGKTVYNLKNSNDDGISISSVANDTLRVTGAVSFGSVNSSTIATGNNLTLVSSSAATAGVADITNNGANSGNSITGNVTVEKYLLSGKKWHFLSVPTTTTQTYRQAWQENNAAGVNSKPGYGMNVYGQGSWAANGFDYAAGAPTVKIYNASTSSYNGIGSTLTAMNTNEPHMVYIRGDRSITAASVTTTSTVLRTTGTLKQGTQSAVTITANKFVAVSNPYAAAVDMRKIEKTAGVQDFFYVWDPKLGGTYGLGAYQLFSKDGSDYVVTPGGGSYGDMGDVYNYIKSGQAFFVKGAAAGGTITFKENAKASGTNAISSGRMIMENEALGSLRANLYVVSADTSMIADGIMVNFSSKYSNDVDADDAVKNVNGSENVGLKRNGQLLSIERHYTVSENDTLFLNLTGLRVQNYRWAVKMSNLNLKNLTAYLVDSYSNTTTTLNAEGITQVNFSVVNIAGSYATDRFKIVFKKAVKPTKTETALTMRGNDTDAVVAEREIVPATGINVYPNPVEGKLMNVRFDNQNNGNYNLLLTNQVGQTVYTGTASVTGKSTVKQVQLNRSIPAGTYTLTVVSENGTRTVQSIVIL